MKKSKKVTIGILIVALLASLSIGGTLAYLTDTERATNTFSISDLDIKLDEPNWNDGDGDDLTPGDTLEKDPTVTAVINNSYMRVVMRVKDNAPTIPNPEYISDEETPEVDKEIANPDYGKVITDQTRLDKILPMIRYDSTYNVDGNPITSNLKEGEKYSLTQIQDYPTVNESKFTLDNEKSANGEYYYNYNGILKENDKVVLFTNIVVPTEYNKNDLQVIGKFQIEVYAQAIQSDNFENSDDAFAALDREITNGTVQEGYATEDNGN